MNNWDYPIGSDTKYAPWNQNTLGKREEQKPEPKYGLCTDCGEELNESESLICDWCKEEKK